MFFSMSDSEEARARSSRNDGVWDPSVSAVIRSAVSESMGSLTDNLTKVIESRQSDFPRRIARPLNKQSRELGANNIPAKGAESSIRFNPSKDLVLPWAEQASRAKAQGAHETNLGETKISRQVENSDLPLGSHFNKRLL